MHLRSTWPLGALALAIGGGCTLLTKTDGLSTPTDSVLSTPSEAGSVDVSTDGGTNFVDADSDGEVAAPSDGGVSFLFAVGGATKPFGAATSRVLATKINDDGSLGAWALATDLPEPRTRHVVTGLGDSLFVFGGVTANDADRTNVAFSLRVLPDAGTTSVKMLPNLSSDVFDTPPGRSDQRLYVFSPSTDTVDIATIQSSQLGAWVPQDGLTAGQLTWYGSPVIVGDHAFWFGPGPRAMTAKIDANGMLAPWSALAASPVVGSSAVPQVVAVGQHVYLVGTSSNTSDGSNLVYVADVATDGTLGDWRQVEPFPVPRYQYRAITHNGFIYVLGGLAEADGKSLYSVYFTKAKSDGSLDLWQETTSLVEWRTFEYAVVTP